MSENNENNNVVVSNENTTTAVAEVNIPLNEPETSNQPSTENNNNNDSGVFEKKPRQWWFSDCQRPQWAHLPTINMPKWEKNRWLSTDASWLIFIGVICLFAIGFSIFALTANSWTCDSTHSFGLWNTCFSNAQLQNSSTNITQLGSQVQCAQQNIYEVRIDSVTESRIDAIHASQGLLVSGACFYLFSVVAIFLAYRFISANNMNSVRNSLVSAMCVQIIAFVAQLLGLYLFVLTDRVSTSVSLLFIYFALAIFGTNIVNFITVEYKVCKMRQVSI